MKWFRFALGSTAVIAAIVLGAVYFGGWQVHWLTTRVNELEKERTKLIEYAQRLSAARRVAQLDVLEQRSDATGIETVVQWQEIGPDGALGRPLRLECHGALVYVEALVIKFEHERVGAGETERGVSLAFFRRVFGDEQSPQSGAEIDRGAAPPHPNEPLHAELWKRFWELIDDPKLARDYGVRVAQVEAPAVPMKPGQIWEMSLDAAGGLNLRKLADRTQ